MKKAILVIDDNSVIVRALRILLGNDRYDFYGAGDGAIGVEVFFDVRPQLVITDMEMPLMAGEEVIEKIRSDSPNQHILAMSSDSAKEDVALKAGATVFVKKPLLVEHVIPYVG